MPRITLFLASQITSHILIDYLLAKSRERKIVVHCWWRRANDCCLGPSLHLTESLPFSLTFSSTWLCFPLKREFFFLCFKTLNTKEFNSVLWRDRHISLLKEIILLSLKLLVPSLSISHQDITWLAYKMFIDPVPWNSGI